MEERGDLIEVKDYDWYLERENTCCKRNYEVKVKNIYE